MALIRRFLKEESGATVIEYGLIVAVLSLAIVGGFSKASNALEWLLGGENSPIMNSLAAGE